MSKIIITKKDEVFLKIDCERSVAYELKEHFSFFVPNYKFHPMYKNKVWDGKINLYNIKTGLIYKGLYDDLKAFAKKVGYEILSTYNPVNNSLTRDDIVKIYENIGGTLKPHDHQIDSLYYSLKYQNALILSPTASGKSYFIYNLVRVLENIGQGLIIVPTTNLVEQLRKDFIDYSKTNGWDADANIHYIYSGREKFVKKPLTISTWQSIYKLPKDYFEQFTYVIGDECHHFKATSLKSIMEKATNARYRIGTTGSLDASETNELTLRGLFGPVNEVIKTHELIEQGKIADLNINVMIMEYDPDPEVLKMDYQGQTEWFTVNEKRNRFIRKVVAGEKGNKLVLFQFVEKHGIPLYKAFKNEYNDHDIFFISGNTPVEEREEIRSKIEKLDNAILVASYGTYSTGMNVPSIKHVFSTSPGKSRIRILQSIGRALRLNTNKTNAQFWDFSDVMEKGQKKNLSSGHLKERMLLYIAQKFKIKVIKVKL